MAAAAAASVLCTVAATLIAVFDVDAMTSSGQLTQALGVISAALFLGAGVLRISRWRIAGDARSLFMGTALVVLGGVAIPLTGVAGVVAGSDTTSFLRADTAMLTTSVAVILVIRALSTRSDHEAKALRLVSLSCLTSAGLFAGVLAVHVNAPELLRSTVAEPPMVRGVVLALVWFVVGYLASSHGHERPWAARVAPLLACMCVAEFLRVVQVIRPGGWELAGAVLVAVVAVLTSHRALLDLDEAATAEHNHLRAVAAALSHTRSSVNEQHAWREEMVHDARNALAGLRAALTTLERYDGKLDGPTTQRLRAAALGEIGHLEHLIIRTKRDETVDFDLERVLSGTVETRRAAGLAVELRCPDLKAHGRPGDVATAVQNLLVNAQQHGGGAVTVHALMVGSRVEVYVADHGPGISATQVATLFHRGARGPASTGTGLGLHVARTLMRQQGGDIELRAHVGGTVFTLSMPAADRREDVAAMPVPEQRHGALELSLASREGG